MPKTVEQQIAAVIKKLKTVQRKLPQGTTLKEGAEDAVAIIRARTRNGFQLSKDGRRIKKLKNTKSTTKRRTRDAKAGILSTKTTANTANLTRTGSLLDNLTYQKVKKNIVAVVPGTVKDTEKAAKLAAQGKVFIGLTAKEEEFVTDKIADKLFGIIKKVFK